ncbi:cyclic AMP response element-binding protein A-like isoform X2 [Eurosta solidaginis]|uniref:cyclic AMP response element-binding protein A-like isoform X2 n=1 Tax=Eurosta solidaginis TaxID=178769 RepID=UPI003530DD10
MEGFYDGDLKDIWDSDLDPTESLKISNDSDLHDWFMERDMKDPAVMILNDKLMSDALFNLQPIKSEHSYSLNSDGDSLPDSPRSLQTKMDDMEDECYPAISLKTATSNIKRTRHDVDISNGLDPKSLAITVDCDDAPMELCTLVPNSNTAATPISSSSSSSSSNNSKATHTLLTTAAAISTPTAPANTVAVTVVPSTTASNTTRQSSMALPIRYTHAGIYASLSKINTTAPMTFNLRTAETSSAINTNSSNFNGASTTTITLGKPAATATIQQQQSHLQQYLPQTTVFELSRRHTPLPAREGSSSPDICSDIEIDESAIKDEPLSPDSSYPPSPNSSAECMTMAKISHIPAPTNSDIVFEHKNGCLQLTPASQSLLKAQQFALNSSNTNANGPNILMPKFNIKSETTYSNSGNITSAKHNGQYGLPLTPPSCSSSDSEGNLTPEHVPFSPNTSVSISVVNPAVITPTGLCAANVRRSASSSSSSSPSSASSTTSSMNAAGRHAPGGVSGTTRQPIHTPLISSQPKGSTGVLLLTEEEKRTLQAEGYPIPQKLPLTKAEEKSLKKIRRKIKNKISAQESRRKKKEYMDQLERRVEVLVNENNEQRKRCDALEHTNASLLSQLHKLQAMLSKQNSKKNT